MTKPLIHLAQFLCHGPTYHSLAMWRHPRTAAAGYEWARPELYQHIARVCERGKFDMVFFADLNYISDTYRGTMDPAIRYATQAPEHDPVPCSRSWARSRRASGWAQPCPSVTSTRSTPRASGPRWTTSRAGGRPGTW